MVLRGHSVSMWLKSLTDEELESLMDQLYNSLKKHNALRKPNWSYSTVLYEKQRRLAEKMNNV